MNCGDERLGVLHAERIDLRAILLFQACTSKTPCRVVLLGMVAVAKFKRTSEDADGVVICFLAPLFAVRDRDQFGVTYLVEEHLS